MNLDFKIRSRRSFDESGEPVCKILFRHEKGNSSTQSNPNNSQTVTDQRVAATEGSIAATSGGSVSVQEVSGDIIKSNNDALLRMAEVSAETSQLGLETIGRAASDAVYSASQAAQKAAEASAKASEAASYNNSIVAGRAVDSAGNMLRDSLDFASDTYNESVSLSKAANLNVLDAQKQALGFAETAQLSANQLIQRTNDSFTAKLSANAGDAPSTTADNMVKYITIAATIVGLGLAFASRRKA